MTALCCLLLALGSVGPVAGGTVGQSAGLSTAPGGVAADEVLVRVDVTPDGDANWTMAHRVRLDDENATAAFEALRSDVESNTTTYRDRFASRLRPTVAAASEATGREMALRNVSVGTDVREIPRRYGVVTYRFEWEGFTAVDGDRLVVGDALGGLFLDEGTRLLVSWPDGYTVRAADPEPDVRRERTVVWSGPIEFGSDEPRLAVERSNRALALVEEDGAVLGGLGVAAVAVAVAVGLRRRRTGTPRPSTDEAAADPEQRRPADEGSDPAPGSKDGAPPAELLSSEERVLRLLRRDGRTKQRAVGEELDWSDARTSQVVGKLRDEGTVESFRLGRENVLTLSDEESD